MLRLFPQGKKLSRDVEEANDDDGEVSDEDEADEIEPTHKVAAKKEVSNNRYVIIIYVCNVYAAFC